MTLPTCKHVLMEQVPHYHAQLLLTSAPAQTLRGHLSILITKITNHFEVEIHGPTWPAKALLDSLGMTGRQSDPGYLRIAADITHDDSSWSELATVLDLVYHQFRFDPVI